jgi:hypothetical protein
LNSRRLLWALLMLPLAPFSEASTSPILHRSAGSGLVSTDDIHSIMKKKLSFAQKVLEGIALNDFSKIQTGGDELIALSKQAEWKVLRTPEYELQTDSFRRSAQDIVKAARDKNVDGAALAYVELTMTCVRCHKYVRDNRRTQAGPSIERIMAARSR